ncbi:hypothetical protein BLNAU_16459 [Blattamonas nauphoetae]|uniref:Uncharacterized protein n=1 Tax=Blattamonas nauphoetae TaxID=2049346 RepID=A0ABQ9XEJ0_9EUKA|nr:hypothetical protein BLNAU_16459 [Blattamonas nauphoetae]
MFTDQYQTCSSPDQEGEQHSHPLATELQILQTEIRKKDETIQEMENIIKSKDDIILAKDDVLRTINELFTQMTPQLDELRVSLTETRILKGKMLSARNFERIRGRETPARQKPPISAYLSVVSMLTDRIDYVERELGRIQAQVTKTGKEVGWKRDPLQGRRPITIWDPSKYLPQTEAPTSLR